MKKLLAAVILMASSSVMLCAQDTQPAPAAVPADTTPTVDQILEKYITACGGRETIKKLTSRVSKGTFELPSMGASGTWERYAKAPNKAITIIDIPGMGIMKDAFDGTAGWDENPMVGLADKAGDALARSRLDSEFHAELRMKEVYTLTLRGKEKVGAREAYVVEAKPAQGGSPEKLFYDAETGLLIRQDAERASAQGTALVETYLEDYREVDGVKVPFSIRQNMPGLEINLKVTEVTHNVPMEDSRFAKPAAK